MKNKGFTLVELLAIIILLGVIALIVFPNINKVLSSSGEQANEIQKKQIIKAAQSWAAEHTSSISEFEPYFLDVFTLVDEGYIGEDEVLEPTTDRMLDGCVVINLSYDSYDYNYREPEDCN